jgi:CubicO group peptidase (beta-lactamase class C family)
MPRSASLCACCILILAATMAAEPVLPAADEPEPITVLQPFIDNHALAGAVTAVISRDRLLSLEAIGKADLAAGKPMTTDALFWVASMSKPMTATALMMLVDEGKVHLDDAV